MDKWSRMIYNIKRDYDAGGDYDVEYRKLQSKLDEIRKAGKANDEEEEAKVDD